MGHRDALAVRGQHRAAWLVAVVLAAIAVRSAGAEPDTWFASLRVGMWVKVEGTRRPDGVLQASRIRLYTGELDEVALESGVASVDLPRLTIQTSIGIRVVATPETELEGPRQQRHLSLASLKAGDRVKVAGQLQKDGSLLAEEIDIDDPTPADGSASATDAHELTARIESLDRAGLRIVAVGLPIQLGPGTRMRSSLPD